MKCLTVLLLLFVMSSSSWAAYPSHSNLQEQQFFKQNLLQQQIQLLQQQLQLLQQQQQHLVQGQNNRPTNFEITLPKSLIDDFEYVPTVQGYRFSYKLADGTTREENAFISGLRMDDYSRLDSKTADLTAVGVGGRPKIKLKNRKLSPGSLKSLAG